MLYKKLNLPINLPLTNNKEFEDKFVEDIVNKIIKSSKIGEKSSISLFKNFFENSLSEIINQKLFCIYQEIIPLIFQYKNKIEGLYQLLRFINQINSNIDYLDRLKNSPFTHKNLAKILLFSGFITNILSKDQKLLEVIQPEYAIRLNGNISYYKNFFEKINFNNFDTETMLDTLRKQNRLLKFQILYALINQEINIDRASTEFSYLAQATVECVLQIVKNITYNNYKLNCEDFCIIAYGRFGTFNMTANSDLDLVFIYGDKLNKKVYIDFFRNLINVLSTKTAEGILYEVDTKLRPSRNRGPVACTYENFNDYHNTKAYSWEKIALKKIRVITENKFSTKVSHLLNTLNSRPISDKEVAHEILKMRVNINENKKESEKLDKKDLPKWFETKYVAGGQRDIEFLKFFYENKSSLIDQHEIDKKQLLFKKLENIFFKVDQVVNICFMEEKQDSLPSAAINLLINELNEKDLGSLKALVNQGKTDIFNTLNKILESEITQ